MPIIKTINGDLLELFKQHQFNAIAHGCNCFHVQGAGIAGQISKEFPQATKADRTGSKYGDIKKLGSFSTALTPYGAILNLYTQYRPGKESETRLYDSIKKAFEAINACKFGVIGIPKLGAGIAGGDWKHIAGIIEGVSKDIEIVVVEYEKNNSTNPFTFS